MIRVEKILNILALENSVKAVRECSEQEDEKIIDCKSDRKMFDRFQVDRSEYPQGKTKDRHGEDFGMLDDVMHRSKVRDKRKIFVNVKNDDRDDRADDVDDEREMIDLLILRQKHREREI